MVGGALGTAHFPVVYFFEKLVSGELFAAFIENDTDGSRGGGLLYMSLGNIFRRTVFDML